MTPTPSSDYRQRTDWNVRDSQGTLILTWGSKDLGSSPGTQFAQQLAGKYHRPVKIIELSAPGALIEAQAFCQTLGSGPLNIAGPRESQAPGIYHASRQFLAQLLPALK